MNRWLRDLLWFILAAIIWAGVFIGLPIVVFSPSYERLLLLGLTSGVPVLIVLAILVLPRAIYKLDWVWVVGSGVFWGWLQWQTLHGRWQFMSVDTDAKKAALFGLAWLLCFASLIIMLILSIFIMAVRSPGTPEHERIEGITRAYDRAQEERRRRGHED